MRIRYWFSRKKRFARVEFRDGRPSRTVRGIRGIMHKGSFITLWTGDEVFHWHESEVRLVHAFMQEIKPACRKEALF